MPYHVWVLLRYFDLQLPTKLLILWLASLVVLLFSQMRLFIVKSQSQKWPEIVLCSFHSRLSFGLRRSFCNSYVGVTAHFWIDFWKSEKMTIYSMGEKSDFLENGSAHFLNKIPHLEKKFGGMNLKKSGICGLDFLSYMYLPKAKKACPMCRFSNFVALECYSEWLSHNPTKPKKHPKSPLACGLHEDSLCQGVK